MYRKRIGLVAALRASRCSPGFALGLLWLATTGAAPPPHPFRVSVADVAVADDVLDVRVRFFWDDLQFGLMESTGDMEFRLQENDRVDALVEAYINDMLVLAAGGAVLEGRLVERGIQGARLPDEVMWWYRMEYPLDPSVNRIDVTNRLLFNMFEDQRNLIQLTTADGRERTQYFSWDQDSAVLRIR